MKKFYKKFFMVLIICIIIAIAFEIIHIYAVFESKMTGNIELEKGNWKISVNGSEVSSGVDKSFVIDNIIIENKDFVKEGNLAPGLTRKFFY